MRLFSSLSAPPLSRCRFPFSPFPLALSLSLFPFHCSAAQVPRREKVGYLFCERARGTGQPLYFAAACKHSAAARVAACAAKIAALLRGYKKGGRLNGGRKIVVPGALGRSFVRAVATPRGAHCAPLLLRSLALSLRFRRALRHGENDARRWAGCSIRLHQSKSLSHGRLSVKGQ